MNVKRLQKREKGWSFVFLFFLLVCTFSSCVKPDPETNRNYSVEGVIMDKAQRPIQGIRVVMLQGYASGLRDTVFSDAAGKYTTTMTLTTKHRQFIMMYSDPNIVYRDTLLKVTFSSLATDTLQTTDWNYTQDLQMQKLR